MVMLVRLIKHLCYPKIFARKLFSNNLLTEITEYIKESESTHSGEIVFCVEHALNIKQIFNKVTPRQRAIELFSDMHVWDTELNNGAFIYLLLVERDIEIIVDRGLSSVVTSAELEDICLNVKTFFEKSEYKLGVFSAIDRLSQILRNNFPITGRGKEVGLSDEAILV